MKDRQQNPIIERGEEEAKQQDRESRLLQQLASKR
jgi:hypothetical protein